MVLASKIINNTDPINATRPICGGNAKLHITQIGSSQAFLVASIRRPLPSREGVYILYQEIAEELSDRRLFIVHEKVFGSVSQQPDVLDARKRAFGARGLDSQVPITYIEGRPTWGEGVAGVVIHAVRVEAEEDKPWRINYQQTPYGYGWNKDGFTHLILQNLQGRLEGSQSDASNRTKQLTDLFQTAERLLEEQGAKYSDVVRTWFYLEDIVDWYDAFNRIRNLNYQKFGVMPSDSDTRLRLPASTGIAGRNPQKASVVLDLYAIVAPPNHPPCYEQLTSVGQMDAYKYGSAFSRGALIKGSDYTYITLSGTAAIDEKGVSLFINDPERQIACTFEKAMVLLDSHGAALSNSAAAVAYIKHANHVDLFRQKAEEYGLGHLPVVCIVADICRRELLFELECIVAID